MNDLEHLLNHDSHWWYLKELKKIDDGLTIHLIEAFSGPLQNTELVKDVFSEVSDIETTPKSREVIIEFKHMAAFNWFDEQYSAPDDSEIHITKRVNRGYYYQIATQAKFLDFVKKECGWAEEAYGYKTTLYRICTLNDIFEIASFEEPNYRILNA